MKAVVVHDFERPLAIKEVAIPRPESDAQVVFDLQ